MSVSRENRINALDAIHNPASDAGNTASAHNQGFGVVNMPARMNTSTRSVMLKIVQMPSVARYCSRVSWRRDR